MPDRHCHEPGNQTDVARMDEKKKSRGSPGENPFDPSNRWPAHPGIDRKSNRGRENFGEKQEAVRQERGREHQEKRPHRRTCGVA